MECERIFLDYSARKLQQLADRIRLCLDRLTEEQVWARGSSQQNAIGNLLLHLAGNVRQWIISGVGGKPDVRVRDREFSARGDIGKEELWERLEAVTRDAAAVIRAVPAERLGETAVIQDYHVTVLEAIYHVVEHYSMHAGQIIFATKLATGEDLGFYRHLGESTLHTRKTP